MHGRWRMPARGLRLHAFSIPGHGRELLSRTCCCVPGRRGSPPGPRGLLIFSSACSAGGRRGHVGRNAQRGSLLAVPGGPRARPHAHGHSRGPRAREVTSRIQRPRRGIFLLFPCSGFGCAARPSPSRCCSSSMHHQALLFSFSTVPWELHVVGNLRGCAGGWPRSPCAGGKAKVPGAHVMPAIIPSLILPRLTLYVWLANV